MGGKGDEMGGSELKVPWLYNGRIGRTSLHGIHYRKRSHAEARWDEQYVIVSFTTSTWPVFYSTRFALSLLDIPIHFRRYSEDSEYRSLGFRLVELWLKIKVTSTLDTNRNMGGCRIMKRLNVAERDQGPSVTISVQHKISWRRLRSGSHKVTWRLGVNETSSSLPHSWFSTPCAYVVLL